MKKSLQPNAMEIGRRLRETRQQSGLSLTEVARRSGLSASFVSNVERGVNDPTIGSLQRLLAALGISMTDLFRSGENDREVVRRHERRLMMQSAGGKVRYELITPQDETRIEALVVTVQPGAQSGRLPHAHRSVEIGLILRGRLRYWLGDRVYELEEGDSITYDARVPHRYANPGNDECVSVWFLAPSGL